MRHRTRGGICNPGSCAEFHIHIRNTSPDRDVSYLDFVFYSYEQYFIAMEHTRSKSDNNVLYKVSVARTVKYKNFVLSTVLSYFPHRILVTVRSVDRVQDTIV